MEAFNPWASSLIAYRYSEKKNQIPCCIKKVSYYFRIYCSVPSNLLYNATDHPLQDPKPV